MRYRITDAYGQSVVGYYDRDVVGAAEGSLPVTGVILRLGGIKVGLILLAVGLLLVAGTAPPWLRRQRR